MADGRDISSFLSSSPLHVDFSSDFARFLSFNPAKKRFIWNGSVEDLSRFIEVKFAMGNDCDGGGFVKSSTDSCAVFKLPNVTFNFYPNTRTLQIQGSACIDVRNHLEEVVSHLKSKDKKESEEAIFIEDNNESSVPAVNGLEESNGSLDVNETNVPANGSNDADLLTFDSESIRNEFHKLWTVINFIHSKVESPGEHCQTALLQEIDEYKLKCSMYEEKIQSLESERASLLEALRILSTEHVTPSTIVHNSQSSADQWQTVPSRFQAEPSSRVSNQSTKKKKKGKFKMSQEQGVAENTRGHESGSAPDVDQTTAKRPVVVIAGDSLVKNVQGWRVSNGKRVKTVVKSFSGASVNDMFDYIQPTIRQHPEHIILHVGTNDLKNSNPRKVAERIVDLGNLVETESPNTKVTISSLLTRSDDPSLASKIKEVNKILKTFANQNEWDVISHSNLTTEHLNSSGLHLNFSGTKVFASNFIGYVRNI